MAKEYNPKEQIYNKYLEEWVSPEVNREVTHFIRCNDLVKQFGRDKDLTLFQLFLLHFDTHNSILGDVPVEFQITFLIAILAKKISFVNNYITNKNMLINNELNTRVPNQVSKKYEDAQFMFKPIPNEKLNEAINSWLTLLDENPNLDQDSYE